MIRFIKSHKYCLWLLYFAFYFPAFFLLERFNEVKYIINFAPDRLIPFCEWFVFPYFLWYITMPGSLLLLMVRDRGRIFKAVLYDVRLDDDFASYLYYRTQRH